MDFLAGLLGGDMTGSMMQGFKMAQMEKEYKLQEQRQKQDEQLRRMQMEEMGLMMQEQKRLRESRDKIAQKFMPQTVTQTEDLGLLDNTTTTTQNSPLFDALVKRHGPEHAEIVRTLIEAGDVNKALELALKPREKEQWVSAPEGGFVFNPSTGQTVQGNPRIKAPTVRNMNVNGMEVTQQWNPQTGTWDEVARGPKWNPDKKDTSSTEYDKAVRGYNLELKALEGRYQSSKNSLGGEMSTEEWNRQMRDIRARWEPLLKKHGGTGFGDSTSSSKKVVRTGKDKSTGRKVVQYSDGTTSYAD